MTRRYATAAMICAALLAGCGPDRPAAKPPAGTHLVHLDGIGDIRFGQREEDLRQRRQVLPSADGCVPRFADIAGASPVFADGRLVLVWIDPPLATPEGVTVGVPVSQARAAYPGAVDLVAPAGSYRFHGLLAGSGGQAYLFLHDGGTVRKTIVGYEEYARRLFTDGFGAC